MNMTDKNLGERQTCPGGQLRRTVRDQSSKSLHWVNLMSASPSWGQAGPLGHGCNSCYCPCRGRADVTPRSGQGVCMQGSTSPQCLTALKLADRTLHQARRRWRLFIARLQSAWVRRMRTARCQHPRWICCCGRCCDGCAVVTFMTPGATRRNLKAASLSSVDRKWLARGPGACSARDG